MLLYDGFRVFYARPNVFDLDVQTFFVADVLPTSGMRALENHSYSLCPNMNSDLTARSKATWLFELIAEIAVFC